MPIQNIFNRSRSANDFFCSIATLRARNFEKVNNCCFFSLARDFYFGGLRCVYLAAASRKKNKMQGKRKEKITLERRLSSSKVNEKIRFKSISAGKKTCLQNTSAREKRRPSWPFKFWQKEEETKKNNLCRKKKRRTRLSVHRHLFSTRRAECESHHYIHWLIHKQNICLSPSLAIHGVGQSNRWRRRLGARCIASNYWGLYCSRERERERVGCRRSSFAVKIVRELSRALHAHTACSRSLYSHIILHCYRVVASLFKPASKCVVVTKIA